MALIEIDGLPFLKMVIFHGELLNNQRVFSKDFSDFPRSMRAHLSTPSGIFGIRPKWPGEPSCRPLHRPEISSEAQIVVLPSSKLTFPMDPWPLSEKVRLTP